jgi:hypothetical protein
MNKLVIAVLVIGVAGCATATLEQDFLNRHEFDAGEAAHGIPSVVSGPLTLSFVAPIDPSIGDKMREAEGRQGDHLDSFEYEASIRSVRFETNTDLQGVEGVTMALRSDTDELLYAARRLTHEDQQRSILNLPILANGLDRFKPLLLDRSTEFAITVWVDPSLITFSHVVHDTVVRVTTHVEVSP